MKCMRKVALEFDETKIKREPSGSSKGGQFTSKNGGSSTQRGKQEKPTYETSFQKRGISGDNLLDQMDKIDVFKNSGATVNNDGTVVVFHHTNKNSGDTINKTGNIRGAEDGVFFTTKEDGVAKDFGDSIISANIPIELLEIDDDFGDELHLRIPTDKIGQNVDISKFLNKKQKSVDRETISRKVIEKYPQLGEEFVAQQIEESIGLRENAGMANKELQNNLNENLEGVIISGRVKEIESMVGKLARQPENFNTVADLHDVSGVRVTADNLNGINSSLEYIRNNYNVVEEKDNVEDHRDGYRGYHAIIEDESGVKSEIQIRTKTQDTWAKYVHERVYKPSNHKVKQYVENNKELITNYIIGMSDYFHNNEKGISIDKPNCPETLEIELGCM